MPFPFFKRPNPDEKLLKGLGTKPNQESLLPLEADIGNEQYYFLNLLPFDVLETDLNAQIHIYHSLKTQIFFSAPRNYLPHLKVNVQNKKLTLSSNSFFKKHLDIIIYTPTISEIYTGSKVHVYLNNLNIDKLFITTRHDSFVHLNGTVKDFHLEMFDNSVVDAFSLNSSICAAELHQLAEAYLFPRKALEIFLFHEASFFSLGTPVIFEVHRYET